MISSLSSDTVKPVNKSNFKEVQINSWSCVPLYVSDEPFCHPSLIKTTWHIWRMLHASVSQMLFENIAIADLPSKHIVDTIVFTLKWMYNSRQSVYPWYIQNLTIVRCLVYIRLCDKLIAGSTLQFQFISIDLQSNGTLVCNFQKELDFDHICQVWCFMCPSGLEYIVAILNVTLAMMGRRCSWACTCLMWSHQWVLATNRAREFCTLWSLSRFDSDMPENNKCNSPNLHQWHKQPCLLY